MTDAWQEDVEMEHILSDDIGGRLQRARERRGLSLSDAARRTKLSIDILQAIERNDFSRLPGGMFRKAYVRTLAAEVGLDPNAIAADYCARFETAIVPAAESPDAELDRKLVAQLSPSSRRSVVTVATLAAAAAVWLMVRPGPAGPDAPVLVPASEPVAMRNAITEFGRVVPTAIADHTTAVPLRIEMTATGPCWVSAETDGERVVYRLVEPGERLVLEGQQVISLRLGDASAVTVSINDGAGRILGREGEVVELEVTPDSVEGLHRRQTAIGTVM
jgi:cytoskeletal protein RodZ